VQVYESIFRGATQKGVLRSKKGGKRELGRGENLGGRIQSVTSRDFSEKELWSGKRKDYFQRMLS